MTSVEKSRLESLVSRYRKVFSYQVNEGGAVGVEHTIPLTTDSRVVLVGYRCNGNQRLKRRWIIYIGEELYVLRHLPLPHAPVCPVRKKDGTLRLCIDYRALDSRTEDTAIPTGNLLETVELVYGWRTFLLQNKFGAWIFLDPNCRERQRKDCV